MITHWLGQTVWTRCEKIILPFLPLLVGLTAWLTWGPHGQFFNFSPLEYHINALIYTGIWFAIALLLFGKAYKFAQEHYIPTFYGYTFPLPSWSLLMIFVMVGGVLKFFTLPPFPGSAMMAIGFNYLTGSSYLEELFSRSIFVKYDLSLLEFMVINTISSCAFTLMHLGYRGFEDMSLSQLLLNGHFEFSFLLGIIAYKTKRIELTTILHVLHNLARAFSCIASDAVYNIGFPLCLAFCSYKLVGTIPKKTTNTAVTTVVIIATTAGLLLWSLQNIRRLLIVL